jgi:DNA-binding NarL/FixJ family response regulator
MSERATTVVIVDDHTIVREGLLALLNARPGISIVGEAGCGLEALDVVRRSQPDVVLMDLSLPDMSGIEVIYELADVAPATKVVVLSMHDAPEYVRPALRAGVAGYLVKGADIGNLVKAIECAMNGEVFLSPGVAGIVLGEAEDGNLGLLTPRELEILRLVANGKTSRDIGTILSISARTVENHRHSIMQKVGLHDVASLTRMAIRSGLVPPE